MCMARQFTSCDAERPKMLPVPSTRDQPLIFNFEPITERKPKVAGKKRRRRVLYPDHRVRKLPVQTDVAKRLFLAFLSIVILQVYYATEDEASLNPVEANRPVTCLGLVPTSSRLCLLGLTRTASSNLWRKICGSLSVPCDALSKIPSWVGEMETSPCITSARALELAYPCPATMVYM
ncbi:radiation-inducible immediate-early gene IEX-1-like [Pristis pectinata]|uniref:radiation-inducible immediate-early gene IEX-1-like n=1 Tax=Pristis pectinata TaxID=685728 RepID=UPI00223D8087|nr:radiation-inducible immediate-early gene IEX-1-like [Pristis pectinata]